MNRRKVFVYGLGLLYSTSGFSKESDLIKCKNLTPEQVQGPFYKINSPRRSKIFTKSYPNTNLIEIKGYVFDKNCQPVSNAFLDFWQASPAGRYDNIGNEFRGHQKCDGFGRFSLKTLRPGSYAGRTPHIHVRISWKKKILVTQLYFRDEPKNKKDYFFDTKLILQKNHSNFYYNFYI